MKQKNTTNGNGKKILLLLLTYVIIIGLFAYAIQAFDVFPVWDWAMEKVGVKKKEILKLEDKTLLKEESLDKKEARLVEWEQNLKTREVYLKDYQEDIEKIKQQLITKANEIQQKEVQMASKEKEFSSHNGAIVYLADSIVKLPPDEAVKIIKELDDQVMIEIFREINKKAELEEKSSMVELLLQNLPYKIQTDGTSTKRVDDPDGLKKAVNYYKYQAKFPNAE